MNANHILKLSAQGLLVGVFSGLMVCLYRFLLNISESILRNNLTVIKSNSIFIFLFFASLIIMGFITSKIVNWESNAIGSGIPHVNAEIKGYLDVKWLRVLTAKIAGGVLTALGGLSLGPEGPSVQIGAVAGKGISKIFNGSRADELRLMIVGSAVGITAAFNAPLAGVIFVLEEINHDFDKTLVFLSLIAAIVSDFISKIIFGQATILNFQTATLALSNYWLLIILGVIVGFLGYLYNVGMIKSNELVKKADLSLEFKLISIFLISGVVAFIIPEILDGGHFMLDIFQIAVPSLSVLLILLIAKYLFSVVSFSSGAPGGIFLPLLVLGAYIGAIFASVTIPVLGLNEALMYNFIIISMAGFFTATVRSPITGIVLLSEMSGSTESLIAMLIVCIIAYAIPTVLGNKPIYESLYDNLGFD